jgi:transposase
MLKDASSELSKFKPTALKKMGIDEIALVKGKGNYCAVLVDLEKSELIAILERRTQSEIENKVAFMGNRGLGADRRSEYRYVEGIQKLSLRINAQCSSRSR